MDEVMQKFYDVIREEFDCVTYSYQDIIWERYVNQMEEVYRQSRIRQCGCDDYEEYLYKYSGAIPEIYDCLYRERANYFHLVRHHSYMIDTSLYDELVNDGLIKSDIYRKLMNMLDKVIDSIPENFNPDDMPKKIPYKRKRKPYE